MLRKMVRAALAFLALTSVAHAQFTGGGNPFKPPQATVHYAPDRDYDLLNIGVDLTVDWPRHVISGSATNTLAPLRDGLTQIVLDAGKGLEISSVSIDGHTVPFQHVEKQLVINSGPVLRDKALRVTTVYSASNAAGRGFGAGAGGGALITPRVGGFHPGGFLS